MSVIHNDLLLATDEATGYNLTKSLRFRSSASAYLSRTPASGGNRQTWTWSGWVKRGKLGSEQAILVKRVGSNTDFFRIIFQSDDTLQFWDRNSSGTTVSQFTTTQVFRDPSAWYHIVIAVDTTQATESNRFKMYINGSQVGAFTAYTYPSQNANLGLNSAEIHTIGVESANSTYLDGYQTEINFIDGQALTPSSFGETDSITGVWKPKRYTGTYGTNGFYLPFTDVATTSGSNAGLGKDFSGNGNYWTTNNISVTSGATYDSMTDVPTLTDASTANYCVISPINSSATVSSGNLNVTNAASSQTKNIGTISSTFKSYFEVTFNGQSGTNNLYLGVGSKPSVNDYSSANQLGYDSFAWSVGTNNTAVYKYNNNSGTQLSAGASSAGDVFMVAIDPPNAKIWFGKNGTWYASGDPSAGTNAAYTNLASEVFPIIDVNGASSSQTVNANFGQRPFAYTPPTGFLALNTYNLPDSTIVAGNKVMDATTYTGDGASPKSITNAASFKPDFVWIKNRSNAYSHQLYDSVRGSGLANNLQSDNTNSETTNAVNTALYGYLSAFNSNGFSTTNGSDPTSPSIWVNTSGQSYVGWQWQAGQGTTSSNTAGSITSTVSVNASAGFSVVSYTAQTSGVGTVGHGLGVAPAFIITKNRNGTVGWNCYHKSLTGTSYVILNSTGAAQTSSVIWNDTNPTSSVFSFGSGFANSGTYVAYCWSEIAGFSKFGSYTGNLSVDGTFVYLGFRPKFILIKRTDASSNWLIHDSSRDTYNVAGQRLIPNDSAAEASVSAIDFLSNGFKLKVADVDRNQGNIVYAAFAENPFKNSLAR